MLILIEKDSATKIPKEVASLEEAEAYRAQGFVVHVPDQAAPAPAAENQGASDEEEGQGQEGLLKPKRRKKSEG